MFAFTLRVPCRQKLGGYHASPCFGFGPSQSTNGFSGRLGSGGNAGERYGVTSLKMMVPLYPFKLCAFLLMTFSHHAWPVSAGNYPAQRPVHQIINQLIINHYSLIINQWALILSIRFRKRGFLTSFRVRAVSPSHMLPLLLNVSPNPPFRLFLSSFLSSLSPLVIYHLSSIRCSLFHFPYVRSKIIRVTNAPFFPNKISRFQSIQLPIPTFFLPWDSLTYSWRDVTPFFVTQHIDL